MAIKLISYSSEKEVNVIDLISDIISTKNTVILHNGDYIASSLHNIHGDNTMLFQCDTIHYAIQVLHELLDRYKDNIDCVVILLSQLKNKGGNTFGHEVSMLRDIISNSSIDVVIASHAYYDVSNNIYVASGLKSFVSFNNQVEFLG